MRWLAVVLTGCVIAVSCGDAVSDSDTSPDSTSGNQTAIELNESEPPPPAVVESIAASTILEPDDTASVASATEPEVASTVSTTSTIAPTTTAPPVPTTAAPPPPEPPSCVRGDIDFAAVRAGATTDAAKIAEIGAGQCGVVFTGVVDVVNTAGEMWIEVALENGTGWSAARLFDVATLDARTGLTVAYSQIANSIIGGVGGPIVTEQLRAAPAGAGARFPWNGSIESCGTGDTVVCTWTSSDDVTEVFIDVRLVNTASGWVIDAVAAGSCGGEGCGGLREG